MRLTRSPAITELGLRADAYRRTRRPASEPCVTIPTDLLFSAFRQLFPAERMLVCGAIRSRHHIRLSSVVDVTEASPSPVHVRACPARLAQALIDFEHTGSHLALWLHSHPGTGALATHPSDIDLNQERQLREHYASHLLCAIATRDGHLRLWGHAIQSGLVSVRWRGRGVQPLRENSHVYKLDL